MKTKRVIIWTLWLSIITLVAYGQPKPKPDTQGVVKTKFGVKAGVNLSGISNGEANMDFSPGMKADFHVGAVANFHFGYRNEGSALGTGIFGLQPELIYSRQGFAVDGTAFSFDYLTLPVMAKFYVTRSLNIEAGPWFGYLLNVSPASAVLDGTQIAVSDLKGGMDVGAGIGAGYETSMGLTVGARYYLGLSDMAGNLKWKNNVIAVSVGWLF
jgi:hypothetical protein